MRIEGQPGDNRKYHPVGIHSQGDSRNYVSERYRKYCISQLAELKYKKIINKCWASNIRHFQNKLNLSDCEVPPNPDFGFVNVSIDRQTSVYSCNTGFVLTGVATRVCQTDGLGWTGDPPTCCKYSSRQASVLSNKTFLRCSRSLSLFLMFNACV